MDFLRQIVGGAKNRYKQNGYNLDLTYITPRIVAMAFPASGIEKLYRNNIDTVAQLFQKEHKGKYLTVNISGRGIDQKVLKNVVSYDWEDHKAPPFDLLFTICDQVAQFLSMDPERIAVFHCNHGKGRTGTIICCFFLYLGLFKNYKQVMSFYAKKRFEKDGYGVTQPCQIQYIQYFENYLNNPTLYPQVLSIKKITLKGDFDMKNPYIKILNSSTGKIIYNTHDIENTFQLQKDQQSIIKLKNRHFFAGDIAIEIKQQKPFGKNLLISYIFNTAFVNINNILSIKLQNLSPLGKQKQHSFGENFEILVQLRKFCDCGGNNDAASGCFRCKGELKEQFIRWESIKVAFKNRQKYLPMNQLLCYGKQEQPL